MCGYHMEKIYVGHYWDLKGWLKALRDFPSRSLPIKLGNWPGVRFSKNFSGPKSNIQIEI